MGTRARLRAHLTGGVEALLAHTFPDVEPVPERIRLSRRINRMLVRCAHFVLGGAGRVDQRREGPARNKTPGEQSTAGQS